MKIKELNEKWSKVFDSKLSETRRCDSLAMMIGYILSAKNSSFNQFDKRYNKNKEELCKPDMQPNDKTIQTIFEKINSFLDLVNKIFKTNWFGKAKCGMPAQIKIAILWKKICEETMTESFKNKLIKFYIQMIKNEDIKNEYFSILNEGSNGETTAKKIDSALDFIKNC